MLLILGAIKQKPWQHWGQVKKSTYVTWHRWSKLKVIVLRLGFTVVGTPVHIALCHCRAYGRVGAFTLLVYFVPFLLFLEASCFLPPPPQHSPVVFGCAWL